VYRGASLYRCVDLPSITKLSAKFKNGKINNVIVDKNTDRNRDLSSILSDVTTKNGRIFGVIEYHYQDRINKTVKFQDVYTRCTFILSTEDNILVILGRSSDIPDVKSIITKIIDDTQNRVQFFSELEIPPDKMLKLGLKVRNSSKGNWCDRPRFSHESGKFNGHVFHDYSNGVGNCVFETDDFKQELKNSTGFSPIIKFFKCEKLDPDTSNKPKTIRFKHEGKISTSLPYDFEYWEYFIFDLVIPIVG
jgi:hypothetical protein